ncbi:GDSL-type esterase/lipase family protein [Ulvibacterium sp.]|uniref:GDSL-type esterase/lipase family protein n=1 Tax=Ulvibacterium sp. TaxID=2665914 RepID=UPI002617B9B1|nr:GDSL-type esterase/lipase family protein [Ulvibacterium sp.]
MKFHIVLFFLITYSIGYSQDSSRFKDEVEAITKKYDSLWDPSKPTVVFTGSSSIRIWKDLEQHFPQHQIVNSGFGGSQASDLLIHLDELVLKYNPSKVFIYEGDNDIAAHKKPNTIIETSLEIIDKIKEKDSTTHIVLISAKPSTARWGLRRKYKRLNRKFIKLSKKDDSLEFADVWTPMLNGRKVKTDIFIEDGLHMNAMGYELWHNVLKTYMD